MPITSWYDGVSIGNRPNTAEWQETSGLAGPARIENADYIWAQSDGSIGKIFPIRLSDGGDAGAWTLTGASPVDIEDLASANVGGQPYIYLADTGNNSSGADSRGSGIDIRVYRIKEPQIFREYPDSDYPFGTELVRHTFDNTLVNAGTGGATYDGSFSGNATYSSTSKFGTHSYTGDGTGDGVDSLFGSGINPTTTGFTISAWVRWAGTGSGTVQHIFGVASTADNRRWYFRRQTTSGNFEYRVQGVAAVNTGVSVTANQWYHVAMVADPVLDQARVYINGSLVGTTGYTSFTLSANIYIGTNRENGSIAHAEGWQGLIDDFAIYNSALTAETIQEIFYAGAEDGEFGGSLASGTDYELIACAYPGGGSAPTRRDCETMLVDPDNGDMYFVMKRFEPPRLYRLAHEDFGGYSGTQTLEYLGEIYTPPFSIGADNSNGGYYVGGVISPDGTEILLKGYEDVFLFTRNPATQTILQALQETPVVVRAYVGGGYPTNSPPCEPKGEGICYDYYGEDFYTASEYLSAAGHSGSNYPTYKYVRSTREATEVILRQGVNSYTGATDTYIWSNAANQGDNHGADATIVVEYTSGTNERYGLIKFDLSNIPVGSTILGADLELSISSEGQLFEIYEMLQSWTGSSSYTSLGGLPAFDDVDASADPIWDVTFGNYNGITSATAISTDGESGTVGPIKIKIPTDIVQAWVDNDRPNNGFVIYGLTNVDGLAFHSSEAATEANRPAFYVRYFSSLPAPDETDAAEYKASTAYPAQSGERSAQRVPIDYISAGGISFADSRTMNMGRSGSVAKPIGAQVARGADTGVESISNNSAFPAEITALREQRLLPKGVVDKVHKFSSDVSPYLITSGWDWSSGQLNNILYAEMTGDNLITNGDFPSALTGWTATQTVSQSGGKASMPDDTYLYQSITVEANTNYRLSVDIVGEEVGLYVLDEDFVAVITSAHHGGGAALTRYIDFNSGDRTTLIIYIWSSSGGPNTVDNITVKKLRYGFNATFGVEANGVNFLSGGKNIGNRTL